MAYRTFVRAELISGRLEHSPANAPHYYLCDAEVDKPATSATGDKAWVVTTKKLYCSDGTSWIAVSPTPATTVTDETGWGIAKAAGSSSNYAREDHTHGAPANPATRANGKPVYAALSNDTLAQDYATNSTTKLTVTANRTLTTTVPAAGCEAFTIILTSGTASFTITFGTGFKPTGTLATGTVSAKVFVVHWISDGTNLYEAGRTAAMTA
jgi:hypothetical protein